MTVAQLISKLQALPPELIVFIPEHWEHYSYTFLIGVQDVKPVTADSDDGGTFNWGWDKEDNIQRGLSFEGVCLYPVD